MASIDMLSHSSRLIEEKVCARRDRNHRRGSGPGDGPGGVSGDVMADRNKDKAQLFRDQNAKDRKTVEWQRLQDKIRTRDKYICRHCERDTDILLHIHHRYYVQGRRYWDYPDKAFISLCEECHDREEDALFDAQQDLRRAIGWRDGEAAQMKRLAEALDKAPDRHSNRRHCCGDRPSDATRRYSG